MTLSLSRSFPPGSAGSDRHGRVSSGTPPRQVELHPSLMRLGIAGRLGLALVATAAVWALAAFAWI